ncbi:MAG: TetR/AcrR family transcriptional regulator [Sphingobacteriales bacterium]|nr:MAG: TetR/AcrR family transcriptional regulator [Sphingobacteriales bacterium]
MGITERKDRERQEMRRKIIDAAKNMFLEDGYNKTSIRNIAEKIEYSPATIYLYYKDKDELLYEVQREYFTMLYDTFVVKATAADPFERLSQLCKAYVHFGIDHPEYYDLMFIIRAPMNVIEDKELWTNGSMSFEFLMETLLKCMENGCIKYQDPRLAALSIWAMGHGLVSLDIRCRFKVMEMDESMVPQMIDNAIEKFLELIKA